MSNSALLAKPSKVATALILLYATIGIEIISTIGSIEFLRLLGASIMGFLLLQALVVLGVQLFLIYMIGKGKNWARVTLLVLFIVQTLVTISPLIHSLSHSPIWGGLGLVNIVMQGIGMVLLFQSDSSAWFKAMKNLKIEKAQQDNTADRLRSG